MILDDYIDTGSQLLFTFVARNAANRALMQRYERMRLAAIEERQLTCVDFAPAIDNPEPVTALRPR